MPTSGSSGRCCGGNCRKCAPTSCRSPCSGSARWARPACARWRPWAIASPPGRAATRRAICRRGVSHVHGDEALFPCLRGSSIVINLLPLTPATRGLLDARFFAAMPRGAALVNLARGAHVVEADLRAALGTGRLGHAVLDVFEREPLDPKHPFWRHPRVTVLPHAAALSDPRSCGATGRCQRASAGRRAADCPRRGSRARILIAFAARARSVTRETSRVRCVRTRPAAPVAAAARAWAPRCAA